MRFSNAQLHHFFLLTVLTVSTQLPWAASTSILAPVSMRSMKREDNTKGGLPGLALTLFLLVAEQDRAHSHAVWVSARAPSYRTIPSALSATRSATYKAAPPQGRRRQPMQHPTSSGAAGTLARRCTGIMSAIFFPKYVKAFYSHASLLLQMRVEEQTTHFLPLKHSLTYWDCCPGTSTFRH